MLLITFRIKYTGTHALHHSFTFILFTVASWNTQMIVMLDGSQTELGSQVASALFGYILGIACCLGSFSAGRSVYDWLRARHASIAEPASAVDEELGDTTSRTRLEDDQDNNNNKCVSWSYGYGLRGGPLLLSVLLTAAFVYGDAVQGIPFYRQMWMSLLFAPLGALLRWKLSSFNTEQFPRGTLAANLLAASLYALLEALDARSLVVGNIDDAAWTRTVWMAAEVAFCGSLSTVSSFVKEIVAQGPKGHVYSFCTIASAMLLGLAIYSPIVRTA